MIKILPNIKDSQDFITKIWKMDSITDNDMLVTVNINALYLSIFERST